MQHISKSHQSLEKALIILLAFEPQNREIWTVELSKMVSLHKSTVSRLLKVLMAYKFIQQNPQTKKFSLGSANIRLGQALRQSLKTNLVQIAKPFLDELRDRLNETVILEVLSGDSMIMVYLAEGSRMVRLHGSIGDRVPFHAASGAKAFLAFCPKNIRDALLGGKLQRFTKNTITNPKELYLQLEEIKTRGFAFDQEEVDEGTSAVGAPILDYEGNSVAAVVVAGPSQRFKWPGNSPVVSDLKDTAKKISDKLFFKE